MKLSLDFETRSRAPLKKCGAYRYAEHPSTEVLVIAVSVDGGPVMTWDARQDQLDNEALDTLERAITEGWEIHAFNSQFEWTILKYVCPRQFGFLVPKIEQMRCTAAVCRSAGLPPSLEKCADFLKLSVRKDKIGSALIRLFSVPQKKSDQFIGWDDDMSFTVGGVRMTAAEAFQKFVDYCANDVLTEMAVAKVMKPFELQGDMLDWFLADARLNNRGVPVDRIALEHADSLVNQHRDRLSSTFKKLTGLMPSQTAKTLAWLQERGYPGAKLDVATRDLYKTHPGMSDEAKQALRIRGELSFAAVKKIPTILEWLMDDGFIRGSFLWYGAQKTGRWTSKGPQWQNMKKALKRLRKIIEEIYQDVRSGMDLDTFHDFYGDPYEVLASLSRYFVRFEDLNLFDLDFSSVEAKILPMLIECRRILDRFDSGEDIYVTTSKSLTATFGYEVNRDMGKVCVLATQFQGGWHAVYTATGSKWPRAQCEKAVAVIRKENPEFPEAWSLFQKTFVSAFQNPGKWCDATPHVSFAFTPKAPFPRMVMRLPSGRKIVFPHPAVDPITMAKVETYDPKTSETKSTKWERVSGHWFVEDLNIKMNIGTPFLNPNTRITSSFHTHELSFFGHTENGHYGRVKTYGGDLLQSATQATGVDLLVHGCAEAERQGFLPNFLVHDECLAPAIGDPEEFTKALTKVPEWFVGFPLGADTDIVRSYCKN
jgi:DNA polymerase bacteriophage-type